MSSPANKPEWYTIATTGGCFELMACGAMEEGRALEMTFVKLCDKQARRGWLELTIGSTRREPLLRFQTMTRINHTVEQLTTADAYTAFEGLSRISLTVTVPDWHEPFPIQVRMGAANPRKLEMTGLLHVSKAWYINGPVADQWTISTICGPIHVPAGTLIETEELPENGSPHQGSQQG
jgi:hypothetical protein